MNFRTYITVRRTRTFNGKIYTAHLAFFAPSDAKKYARMQREKGINARIVEGVVTDPDHPYPGSHISIPSWGTDVWFVFERGK